MLATLKTSWFPKLPSLDGIRHFFYTCAPDYFRTDGIGANKRFVEQAEYVRKLFTKTNAGRSDSDAPAFVCKKCAFHQRQSIVATMQCGRPILDRSVVGKAIGRMRWVVPACETCDHELPLDVTDPILVDHGRKCEGYIDIPDDILLFFDATVEDAS